MKFTTQTKAKLKTVDRLNDLTCEGDGMNSDRLDNESGEKVDVEDKWWLYRHKLLCQICNHFWLFLPEDIYDSISVFFRHSCE